MKSVTLLAAADAPAYVSIASASCAQNAPYWASVAAIAAVFCPNRLLAISDANCARLAAISSGGTCAANAVSYAEAAAAAWPAVCVACAAVALTQVT